MQVYVSASALYQKTKQGGSGVGVADELGRTSEWMDVAPDGEKPFDFNTQGKLRHWVRRRATLLFKLPVCYIRITKMCKFVT